MKRIQNYLIIIRTLPNLWKQRELIRELIRRDLNQRYRGSFLGMLWSIIIPLIMLLIYTFVFALVFKARWQTAGEDTPPAQFAIILFAAMTPFNIFSDVTNRSPSLIVGVPNYVKKVVFPLEILPFVILGTAIINSLINIVLLIIGNLIIMGNISPTIYLLPLAYLPLIFLVLGLSWTLSSLGVYIRDLIQGVPILVQILFFLSPVFYPVEAAPATFRIFLNINPLTTVIESFRQVIVWGGQLPWRNWGIWTGITLAFAVLGYIWFMKTKKGFADVL